jgi:hypothetical protein
MKKLIFLLIFPAMTLANTCDPYDVKIIYDRKEIFSKEVICTKKTSDNMVFYISKSCLDNKCEILKKKKSRVHIKDYYSNTGSPGFKLCTELSGVPQIFEYRSKKNAQWQSTSRCLFSNRDFVEISLLIDEWKNLKLPQ